MSGTCSTDGEGRRTYRISVGKPECKRPLPRPRRIHGRIILKWIFKKWHGAQTGLIWLEVRQMAHSCESGYKPSDSIKCGEFLD